MENIMNVDPGLIFWTLVNFLIFLFLLIKFGTKPISNGLKSREQTIQNNIDNAAKANQEAKSLLDESQKKLDNAQREMSEIIAKGRKSSEELLQKAKEEADKTKLSKVEEAKREIESSKEAALKELRNEVADLVVQATEKLLDENLDKEKQYKIVNSYIEKLPKN